jgi:hypothetical protein
LTFSLKAKLHPVPWTCAEFCCSEWGGKAICDLKRRDVKGERKKETTSPKEMNARLFS